MLSGLAFKPKWNGCVVLDARQNSKFPKFVGLITRCVFSDGYKLCPFVVRGIFFSIPVPERFKSVENAQLWIERHAIMWNWKRVYTPFNFLIGHILSDVPVQSPLVGLRFQVIFMQLLLAVLTCCVESSSLWVMVVSKSAAGVFGVAALLNVLVYIRERL